MALLFNVLVLLPLGGVAMVAVVRAARRRVRDPQRRVRIGRLLSGFGALFFFGLLVLGMTQDLSVWMRRVFLIAELLSFAAMATGTALLEDRRR